MMTKAIVALSFAPEESEGLPHEVEPWQGIHVMAIGLDEADMDKLCEEYLSQNPTHMVMVSSVTDSDEEIIDGTATEEVEEG